MAKLFGKQRTRLYVSFVFVLGTAILGLVGASCTNLADVVEGNSSETGDGSGDDGNSNNNNGNNNGEVHPVEAVDLDAILKSLAENVILPVYQEFQTAAVALEAASNNYASAVLSDSADVADKLTALEAACKTTMAA